MLTNGVSYFTFLAAVVAPVLLVRGVKIAFVGDTGMEGMSHAPNRISKPALLHQNARALIRCNATLVTTD